MADALAAGDYAQMNALVEQLHREVSVMLFGYPASPKVIRRNVEAWGDASHWEVMDVAARDSLSDDVPAARAVFGTWESMKQDMLLAVEAQDTEKLQSLAGQWHKLALSVHDSYMHYAAVLLSELARNCGAEAMQAVLTEVMDVDAMGIRPEMPFRQRAEALIGFTRLHLLPFRVVEDDEKLTFIADPCPSGGRLVKSGLYNPDGPGEIIRGESPMTYGRPELPAYCCHESALEVASIQRFGSPVFVVDPAAVLGDRPCHVYLYKDPAAVPERYFQRFGLAKADDMIARS